MKFLLKNYEDYILYKELANAKALSKKNPIIKEEVTRIRLNANYYEFQVLDDNLYDVDIVVENDKEVTVNRCSCGSIACAHLACCYERILNGLIASQEEVEVLVDDKKINELIALAKKEINHQKPFNYILEFICCNSKVIKGYLLKVLESLVKDSCVISFDYSTRKLFTRMIETLGKGFYSDDEVFLMTRFMIKNFVSSYGTYRLEMLNLISKTYPVVFNAINFIDDHQTRIPKNIANKCCDLFKSLNLHQYIFEFMLSYPSEKTELIYPYDMLYQFVVYGKKLLPFEVSMIEDPDRLIKIIYQHNPSAAITLMKQLKIFPHLRFSLQEVLSDVEFFCLFYPQETKMVLEDMRDDNFIASVDEVKKLIAVASSFGDDYLQHFLEELDSEFVNTIAHNEDYLIIDNTLPFAIELHRYYNFYPGKDYLFLLKPSIVRKGDDILALDSADINASHTIYLNENHQIMGSKCYRCGHLAKPCIHQSSIIHLLNSFNVSNEMLERYNELNSKLKQSRDAAFRKIQKANAIKRMNYYEERFAEDNTDLLVEKVDIIPNIILDKQVNNFDSYSLNFKIQHANLTYKLYPEKFNNAMDNALDYSYGKKLHFKHTINNFTDRAKIVYNSIADSMDKDMIRMSASRLASFLLSLKDSGIEINNEMHYFQGNLALKLSITNDKKLDIINKNELKGKFIFTPSDDFYFDKGSFYLLNYENAREKIIIRDILENGEVILDEIESSFIEKIYPFLKKQLIIDKDFLNDNSLEQLVIKAYFDYLDGVIDVKYQFFVNEVEIKDEDLSNYQKNEIKPFLLELEKYGFENNLLTKKDDIINFVNSDLSILRQEATIYITSNLKKLFTNESFKVKMVVNKKNESILDIYFENLDYSEEELYSIYQAYKKQKKYILLSDKIINLKSQEVGEFVDLVDELEMDSHHLLSHYENPLYNIFKMQKNTLEFDFSNEIKDLLSEIKNYQKNEFPLNDEILKLMRPYQLNGFKWMRLLLSKGLGCILADDMGIGKTLQTIAVIDSFNFDKPVLVVCPKNIIYNWEAEVSKWAPWLTKSVIIGNKKERIGLFEEVFANKINIAIASYETIRIEEAYLKEKEFALVILDEAQNIKNPMVERTRAVKNLKANYRLALTGTPIENSLSDAWSIFDYLIPGYLYKYQRFISEIAREENFGLMKKKLLPFVLRRTKNEVLKELPKKTEELVYIAFNDEEKKLYQSELLHAKMLLENDPDNRMRMLANITQLREICVDPHLVYENYTEGSAKTETLLEMLNNLLLNNHKVLIFSQFVKYLKLLEEKLKALNIDYYLLTGDTSAIKRQEMANDFNANTDKKVFLVSLKAGGVGLNLIGADTVIHVDPWWNYAIESQASDRAYRIGQTRPVTIYKLVMKNSIEEKVIKLQEYKKHLSNEVINENDEMMSKLSIKDFEALLN